MTSRPSKSSKSMYTLVPNEPSEEPSTSPEIHSVIKNITYYGVGALLLLTHFSVLFTLLHVIWLSYDASECPHF